MGGGEKTFSLSSEIEPNIIEWKKGTNFTCKATHEKSEFEETTSICKMHTSTPPSVDLETPSFKTVMTATSDVKAKCLIRTVFDAKVTWQMNEQVARSNTVFQTKNTSYVISEATVSSRDWKRLKHVTCRAEHACFSSVRKTKDITESEVPAPVVTISRSLPDLLKGDSAVLKCEITKLPSREFSITLQANGVAVSDNRYVDFRNALDVHSISERFNVSQKYWRKDQNFTCKVKHGFSSHSTSRPIGNVFVDPSVELLLMPSEESDSQTLLCSGSGFDPQIKWFSDFNIASFLTKDTIAMGADGRVVVTSQLQVPPTKWQTGKVFTCEVSDKSLSANAKKIISVCSVTPASSQIVEVYVQGPPLQQLLNKDEGLMTITCLLVGHQLNDFSIIWKVDNSEYLGQNTHTEQLTSHSNGTETMQSFFKVSAEEWHAYKQVSCEGKHRCSKKGYEAHISKSTVTLSEPSVLLLQGSNELVCLAFGFTPEAINITWFRDGTSELWDFSTSEPQRGEDGNFSIRSHLRLSLIDSPGAMFTCKVTHAGFTQLLNLSGPDTLGQCDFLDHIIHAEVSQDTGVETVNMTFTFLTLFLISTVYGIFATMFKTK